MAKTKDRIGDTAENIRPYVERAVKDEEIRRNVRDAFDAAREIYGELMGPRGMAPLAARVASDEDIQENLRRAVGDLRKAANRLQGKEEHSGRNSFLLLVGITIGILFNPVTGPATRDWLKSLLGGGDEDFTYQGNNSGG
jgi:uncharacterized protein (UPF0147 family)